MKKLLLHAVILGFLISCKNNDDKAAADTIDIAGVSADTVKALFKGGVLVDSAEARITRFQESCFGDSVIGVYYSLDDLRRYIAKFEDITNNQPEPPQDYDYQVGHFFALEPNGKISFIVAPVLVHNQDSSRVIDPFRTRTSFNTGLLLGHQPHFYYNEGHLFP